MAGTFKARSQHPMGSLRTLSGLIMMVNFLLLLMSALISLTWRTNARHYPERYFDDLKDKWAYHIAALAVPVGGYLLIQFISTCCCDCKNFRGLADILMMLLCLVFGALIIVSGVFLQMALHDRDCFQQRNCQQLRASIIIGYVSSAFLFAESFFHLSEKNIVMNVV
ncbi:uncharacterized protein [Clytia hemisphaerica]|uniref:Uncharacterized protein n=1 Tax=Clytia hemisphaerica TaxID=252671 RepID=A0A7M5VAM9_9CNID|eukprot:TCONS_00024733-protein